MGLVTGIPAPEEKPSVQS